MKRIHEYELRRVSSMDIAEPKIESPAAAYDFLAGLALHEYEQERLIAIYLSTKNTVRGYSVITIGLIDRSQAHPREVFRCAIINGASRIILAHNHPSGDVTPSTQDIAATQELSAAAAIVQIEIIDHVIIGRPNQSPSHFSFRENGLLSAPMAKKKKESANAKAG